MVQNSKFQCRLPYINTVLVVDNTKCPSLTLQISHWIRGISMSLVRFTQSPGKGCGRILNEDSISSRVLCGMESIHKTEGQPMYYLCPDCYLRSIYSEDAASTA